MPRYRVELLSIDRNDESKNIQFLTYVNAANSDDSVAKARDIQKNERPDINPTDNWFWCSYQTFGI